MRGFSLQQHSNLTPRRAADRPDYSQLFVSVFSFALAIAVALSVGLLFVIQALSVLQCEA